MDKERLGIRKGKLFLWKFKLKFLQMSCSGSKESIQPPNSSVFLSIIDIWCQSLKTECPAYLHFFFSFLFLQTYPQFPSRFKHRWLPYCDISKNATLMFNGIKNPLGSNAICYQLIVILEDSLLFENMGSFYMLPEEQYEMSYLLEKVLDWVWPKISHKGDNTY